MLTWTRFLSTTKRSRFVLYIAFLRFVYNCIILKSGGFVNFLWIWSKKPSLSGTSPSRKGLLFWLFWPLRRIVSVVSDFFSREFDKHSEAIVRGRLAAHLGGHFGFTNADEGALVFLKESLGVKSMIDMGCGPGKQVRIARGLGIEAFGIDGDHTLKFSQPYFFLHDFTKGKFPCARKFDLVWSVEFLEHVEEQYQPFYMAAFRLAKTVVCTAALPGQLGFHHVNCRDQAYWIRVFKRYGFAFDKTNTQLLKEHSTMGREFMRETGMLFVRKDSCKGADKGAKKR